MATSTLKITSMFGTTAIAEENMDRAFKLADRTWLAKGDTLAVTAEDAKESVLAVNIKDNSEDRVPAVNTEDEVPAVNTEDEVPAVNTEDEVPAFNTEDEVPAVNTENEVPAINTKDNTEDNTEDNIKDNAEDNIKHNVNTKDGSLHGGHIASDKVAHTTKPTLTPGIQQELGKLEVTYLDQLSSSTINPESLIESFNQLELDGDKIKRISADNDRLRTRNEKNKRRIKSLQDQLNAFQAEKGREAKKRELVLEEPQLLMLDNGGQPIYTNNIPAALEAIARTYMTETTTDEDIPLVITNNGPAIATAELPLPKML